jgi:hypothetical protein
VSKESQIKKRLKQSNKQQNSTPQPPVKRNLTDEERAAIIRDRLAHRPVIMFRYPNGKLNKKFIITMVLMVIALAVALYFSAKL